MPKPPSILIVGAGPCGLFFAHEMIKRGHDVRIIEQKKGPSTDSKALIIHARTLEILDQAGLVAPFLQAGHKTKGMTYYYNQSHVSLNFTHLPTPYPYILSIPQSKTEQILLQHFQTLGASVEWNTKLERLDEGICYLSHADGSKESIQPDWIIGADGGRSCVRNSMDLNFIGRSTTHTIVLVDVQGDISLSADHAHLFVGYQHPLAIFPFPPHTYRIAFIIDASDSTKKETYTLDYIEQLVQQRCNYHLGKLHAITWFSEFQINTCYAKHFRKDNCFLIGDAAHIHSPLGGQGMNMGLQDGYNLSWKLDLVIKGLASTELLNTYEYERQNVVRKILATTEKFTDFIFVSPKWLKCLFLSCLNFFNKFPKIADKLVYHISQLALNYCHTASKDSKWKGPKVGQRAPYAHLKDGRSIFELFRSQKYVILIFENNPALLALVARFAPWVDIHVIEGEEIKRTYANGPQSLYVIRPDGYIGYRNQTISPTALENYLNSILSTRNG